MFSKVIGCYGLGPYKVEIGPIYMLIFVLLCVVCDLYLGTCFYMYLCYTVYGIQSRGHLYLPTLYRILTPYDTIVKHLHILFSIFLSCINVLSLDSHYQHVITSHKTEYIVHV